MSWASLYRRANDSYGRHGILWTAVVYVLGFLSVGALASWAAHALDWYWHWFRWLGLLYAVLVSWILLTLLIIVVRALIRYNAPHSALKGSAENPLPILSPAQENLLMLLAKYQRQYTASKLIISSSKGTLYFDGNPERGKDVHLFSEMFGSDSPDSRLKFEMLMDSMPVAFVTRIPESRLDNPFVVALTEAGLRYLRDRNLQTSALIQVQPRIEICFQKGAPYEVTDVSHGQVLSTVRIGIRNYTGAPLSNCQVYVDQTSPAPSSPHVTFPIQLAGGGFTMRADDPEHFVDVATQWDFQNQFRFNSPPSAWAEGMNYVDDSPPRVIVLRMKAIESQRSASFRIMTDDTKKLRLEPLGHI